jgi:hypothetical protein
MVRLHGFAVAPPVDVAVEAAPGPCEPESIGVFRSVNTGRNP